MNQQYLKSMKSETSHHSRDQTENLEKINIQILYLVQLLEVKAAACDMLTAENNKLKQTNQTQAGELQYLY